MHVVKPQSLSTLPAKGTSEPIIHQYYQRNLIVSLTCITRTDQNTFYNVDEQEICTEHKPPVLPLPHLFIFAFCFHFFIKLLVIPVDILWRNPFFFFFFTKLLVLLIDILWHIICSLPGFRRESFLVCQQQCPQYHTQRCAGPPRVAGKHERRRVTALVKEIGHRLRKMRQNNRIMLVLVRLQQTILSINMLPYSVPCNLRPLYLTIPCILRLDISDTTRIFSV